MRDALSILDQMICICDNNITIDKISSSLGLVSNQNYFKILKISLFVNQILLGL